MCFYDGDSREPHYETIVKPYEEGHLKEMSSDAYGFGFNGDFGNANHGPLYRDRKYWSYKTCKGFESWEEVLDDLKQHKLPQAGCLRNPYYDNDLQIGNIPD